VDSIDDFYKEVYENFIGTGVVGFVAKLTHFSIELGGGGVRKRSNHNLRIIEVGAGNGQHLNYVKHDYLKYLMTDLRPEMLPAGTEKIVVDHRPISAEKLPYPNESFDRLIATCLIAHLSRPQDALLEWERVLGQKGFMDIYVPCEPGILLRLLQKMITNPKKKKQGVGNPNLLHYRDHIQPYPRVKAEIEELGLKTSVKRYPFPFLSWNFNLWVVFHIQK